MITRTIFSVILGGLAGFAWYRMVGCRTGTCLISGNPYIATLYGALLGYFLSGGLH
jgi:hypothetical protein